jgi:hypothetical protein
MSALRSILDMPTTAMDRTLRGLDSAEIELNIGAVLHFDGAPPCLGDIQDYIAARLTALPALAVWMPRGARHWTVVDEVDLTSPGESGAGRCRAGENSAAGGRSALADVVAARLRAGSIRPVVCGAPLRTGRRGNASHTGVAVRTWYPRE